MCNMKNVSQHNSKCLIYHRLKCSCVEVKFEKIVWVKPGGGATMADDTGCSEWSGGKKAVTNFFHLNCVFANLVHIIKHY